MKDRPMLHLLFLYSNMAMAGEASFFPHRLDPARELFYNEHIIV